MLWHILHFKYQKVLHNLKHIVRIIITVASFYNTVEKKEKTVENKCLTSECFKVSLRNDLLLIIPSIYQNLKGVDR